MSVFRALDSSAASRVFFDVSSTGCDVSSDILSPNAAGELAALVQEIIVREPFFCFEQQRRETTFCASKRFALARGVSPPEGFANCMA